MQFQDLEAYFKELDKMPAQHYLIHEDYIYWLRQDYAVGRMNEIYGKGNWAIEKIKKDALGDETGKTIGHACVLTVGYKHPVNGSWLTTTGVCGTDGELDNNIIGRAFLNAIASLGNTFGRHLLNQFEK